MTVELWLKGDLDTVVLDGDLQSLMHNLNVAAANGKHFAILEDAQGDGVMIEMRNITKARERKDDDAFIGG